MKELAYHPAEQSAATPIHNYTPNSSEGVNYAKHRHTDIKEIAQKIREKCKEKYPDCKFSVTIERYSGGQSMNISLMAAPFEVCTGIKNMNRYNSNETETIKPFNGYTQLNHYCIQEKDGEDIVCNGAILTPQAGKMLTNVVQYTQSFNYDDSDSMTDYFDVNFYLHLSIGKFDKPFKQTESEVIPKCESKLSTAKPVQTNGACEVGEYKGYPTIKLPLGSKGFTFGLSKAKAIIEHIDEIRSFVEARA